MIEVINKLSRLIDQISNSVKAFSEEKMSNKLSPKKWSKKEILGHLVDSGINNLQRFTTIQFAEKPYQLTTYKQDELVEANNYQNAETKDILDLLVAINRRIIDVIRVQTDETLNYEIMTYENVSIDLKYLIEDYVKHFEHHVNQIIEFKTI